MLDIELKLSRNELQPEAELHELNDHTTYEHDEKSDHEHELHSEQDYKMKTSYNSRSSSVIRRRAN